MALALTCPAFAQPEQSPIDIIIKNTIVDPDAPVISFNVGFSNIQLKNTYGTRDETTRVLAKEWATLKVFPKPMGPSIRVDGVQYDLVEFHFHTPSEHAVNGKRTPMEVHFVFLHHGQGCAAGERPLVVLGAFIKEGHSNPELQLLFPEGLPRSTLDSPVDISNVDLGKLLPPGQPKWRYEGGLTAPSTACSWFDPLSTQAVTGEFPEAAHWFFYADSLHLPKPLINRFQELFPEGNSRTLKEVDPREVYARKKKHE